MMFITPRVCLRKTVKTVNLLDGCQISPNTSATWQHGAHKPNKIKVISVANRIIDVFKTSIIKTDVSTGELVFESTSHWVTPETNNDNCHPFQRF